MEIKQINVLGQTYDIRDAFGRALIASEFNSENTYEVGDVVQYSGLLYSCVSSTTGGWISNNWNQTYITDFVGKEEEKPVSISSNEWELISQVWNKTISGTFNCDVEELGAGIFYRCLDLTEVNLPNCIRISIDAFGYCSQLMSVNLPKCTELSQGVFYQCHNLQSVSLPNLLSITGNGTFGFCSSLTKINLPKCLDLNSYTFRQCINLSIVELSACTSISDMAFWACTSLQSVSFPVCTTIGYAAFADCTSLQSASFPACTIIDFQAFEGCTLLSAIYLLASSVCNLVNSNAFQYTPIQYSSYLGYFGSIYVPESLVNAYKTSTNWIYYSNRIIKYEG